jgi:ribonuclease P protein component
MAFVQPLRKSRDFQALRKGRRKEMPAFIAQGAPRPDDRLDEPRVGLTVTRKIGTACERNRIKRRLRHLVRDKRLCLDSRFDYVLVARRVVLSKAYAVLGAELERALSDIARHPWRGQNATAQPSPSLSIQRDV